MEWRVVIAVVAVLCSVFTCLTAFSENEMPERSRISAYTSHAPIYINGDVGFLGSNASTGISCGSGTTTDPYIIEGWDINATSSDGIEIRNANVSFIIRNCLVYRGTGSTNAIFLYHCSSGRIFNNSCTNCTNYGIEVERSEGIEISNNTCWNNRFTIRLYLTNDSIISNNTCHDNQIGIFPYLSRNLTISNNTCTANECGLQVFMSDGNIILDNVCINNTDYAVHLSTSRYALVSGNTMTNDGILITGNELLNYNSHSIDSTNMINGMPAIYVTNQSGFVLPIGAGQIILANCTNMAVTDRGFTDVCVGVELAYCSNIAVTRVICSDTAWGIYLYASSNNDIYDCNCSGSDVGIRIGYSNGNEVYGNNCSGNVRGIELMSSDWSDISGNIVSNNSEHGISLISMSDRNNIKNNLIENNTAYGIWLFSGTLNRIWNNTFIDNNGATVTYDPGHIQAMDDAINNWWNTTGTPGYGNYWSDWTTPDTSPTDGIVDAPYVLDGGVSSQDEYPLTLIPMPIPEFLDAIIPIIATLGLFLLFRFRREER
jgi:parallel beta-helix repeat protein